MDKQADRSGLAKGGTIYKSASAAKKFNTINIIMKKNLGVSLL